MTVIPDGNISMGFAVVLLTRFACTLLCQLAFVFLSATVVIWLSTPEYLNCSDGF